MPGPNRAVFYTTADNPPQVHPALVAQTNIDGSLDLYVFFPDDKTPLRVFAVAEGHGPHSWFDPREKFST